MRLKSLCLDLDEAHRLGFAQEASSPRRRLPQPYVCCYLPSDAWRRVPLVGGLLQDDLALGDRRSGGAGSRVDAFQLDSIWHATQPGSRCSGHRKQVLMTGSEPLDVRAWSSAGRQHAEDAVAVAHRGDLGVGDDSALSSAGSRQPSARFRRHGRRVADDVSQALVPSSFRMRSTPSCFSASLSRSSLARRRDEELAELLVPAEGLAPAWLSLPRRWPVVSTSRGARRPLRSASAAAQAAARESITQAPDAAGEPRARSGAGGAALPTRPCRT